MTISLSSINIGAATAIREQQSATASQTVFTLANTYSPGTNSLEISINGVRQFPGTFTETSANVVTFSAGLTAGDIVLFEIGKVVTGNTQTAAAVSFSPVSGLSSTDVQNAITTLNRPVVNVSGTTQTASVGVHYVCTNVAATTVTLPASASEGDNVVITFTNGLTTNVIARNGLTIMGSATDMTVNSANVTVRLRYLATSWRMV